MEYPHLQGPQPWDEKIARLLRGGRKEEEEEEPEPEPEPLPPRRAAAREAPVYWTPAPVESPPPPAIQFYTAADLETLELPPCRWALPELLPAGLTLLGGKPKQGKSWMALALALAVAGGGTFLEQCPVTGDVLYLALEDQPRRLQERLDRLRGAGLVPNQRLVFATEWPSLGEGGGAALEEWLVAHPEARLVIIDTLARVRPPQRGRGNLYLEDYALMNLLKELADRFEVALLVVHHLRKQGADDEFDTISGTTGLTGAADAAWVLQRTRGQREAILWLTGRDVEEQKLSLCFDPDDCLWRLLGTAAEAPGGTMSERRQEVLALLAETPLTPRELGERLQIERNAAKALLHRMARDGLVVSESGCYRLVDDDNA
jgi:AAA domain-containing protein